MKKINTQKKTPLILCALVIMILISHSSQSINNSSRTMIIINGALLSETTHMNGPLDQHSTTHLEVNLIKQRNITSKQK